ncbi:MAG: class I SAM-dependent methyltransferase, partial [Micromonosporaceae bacterium]|nr:class I SAM-dependent methyltransferase [Micromonosporaceae bacterium]
ELLARLGSVAGPGLRVVGLEIDTGRVAAAQASADPPSLAFTCGGFELAGLRPHLVRAMNVLRQYEEGQAAEAWAMMATALAPGGVLVEGTCDETGTLAAWVALDQAGPRSLTLSMDLEKISSPAVAATRLPKALIHHNVPGERVHDFLGALEHSWRAAAAYAAFGPRQRWWHAVSGLRDTGWPVIGGPRRWRQGEVTVRWNAVAPTREALRPLRGHNQP